MSKVKRIYSGIIWTDEAIVPVYIYRYNDERNLLFVGDNYLPNKKSFDEFMKHTYNWENEEGSNMLHEIVLKKGAEDVVV